MIYINIFFSIRICSVCCMCAIITLLFPCVSFVLSFSFSSFSIQPISLLSALTNSRISFIGGACAFLLLAFMSLHFCCCCRTFYLSLSRFLWVHRGNLLDVLAHKLKSFPYVRNIWNGAKTNYNINWHENNENRLLCESVWVVPKVETENRISLYLAASIYIFSFVAVVQ